ncbi:MAG: hypothetical protein ACYTAQ_10600 [Planctomycetota bacterium]
MASLTERSRNNVRAGIFVSVAILAAVATIIVLTDAWRKLFEPIHRYTVTWNAHGPGGAGGPRDRRQCVHADRGDHRRQPGHRAL